MYGALGAALGAYHIMLDQPRNVSSGIDAMKGSYLGPEFSQQEIIERLTRCGAIFKMLSDDEVVEQTAQAIAQSTHLQIIEDEIWTELSFGHWDGLTTQEVREKFGEEYEAWLSSTAVAPKEGESHNSIAARIEAGLSHLVDTYPGKKVVVVTHNMVIRHAVRITVGAPIDGVFHIDIKPASVTSLTIWPSDGLRCLRMVSNDSHLN